MAPRLPSKNIYSDVGIIVVFLEGWMTHWVNVEEIKELRFKPEGISK